LKNLPRILNRRSLFAILSGLSLAASFPKMSMAGLAWVAPGVMLMTALGCSSGQTFRLGYLAGLAHYLTSLYWLLNIPVSFAPVAGWLALAAYLALYPAVWVWLCWKCFPNQSSKGTSTDPGTIFEDENAEKRETVLPLLGVRASFPFNILFTPENRDLRAPKRGATWPSRAVWIFSCAALWVALEMIVARLFTGFPWNLLGASQYQVLPLIQIASLTGIYGVSFLVVWCSVALASSVLSFVQRPALRWFWLGDLALPLLALMIDLIFGVTKFFRPQPDTAELKVALIQPSIPQKMIWDPKENSTRFKKLLELSELALATKPDLLIWPEATVPGLLRFEEEVYQPITNLVRTHHTWLLLGADDAELAPLPGGGMATNYYNSSFLVNPDGNIAGIYRKRQLVIFGEYVPLASWLPLMKYLTPIDGGFTPGDRPVSFTTTGPKVKMSVLICFEDTFPHLAREYVEDDTDFLVNITNNGWFGESAAQWQHAASAVFRAVENGLPLVRCCNNGLSCWIDERGRVRQIYGLESKDIYGAGFMTARIPLLGPDEKRASTFYNRHGDWFGWGCVAMVVVRLGWRLLRFPSPPRTRRGSG